MSLFSVTIARLSMADSLPTIDKGVPLPSRRFDEGHPLAVLKKMEVEDSVFFRGVTSGSRAYEVLQNRMSRLKKNKGWVLVSRSRIEDGDKGVRVWRRI